MNRSKRRAGISGFTLIEVLVALFVMGITLAALSKIGGTSAKASRSLAARTQTIWQNEQVANMIIRNLKIGIRPEIPENIRITTQPSAALSGTEIQNLAQAGWRLVHLKMERVDSLETVWEGELLLGINQNVSGVN